MSKFMRNPSLPQLPPQVPRRGNFLSRWFGKSVMFLTGWQFEGQPPDTAKFVIIAAPHTSNWDAVYGLAAVLALGLDANWMAKHTVFKGMFGDLLKWLGGIPIRRDASYGVVERVVSLFQERRHLVLAITPEGTRKRVTKWKTGFYYIALQADVPVALGFLDYSRRVLGFGPTLVPSGDIGADFIKIQRFYEKITGKYPEKFNRVIFDPKDFEETRRA